MVSSEEAKELADEFEWQYFEASAKSGWHVRDAFYLLACTVMNRINEADPKNLINRGAEMEAPPTREPGLDLTRKGPEKGSKSGCC